MTLLINLNLLLHLLYTSQESYMFFSLLYLLLWILLNAYILYASKFAYLCFQKDLQTKRKINTVKPATCDYFNILTASLFFLNTCCSIFLIHLLSKFMGEIFVLRKCCNIEFKNSCQLRTCTM